MSFLVYSFIKLFPEQILAFYFKMSPLRIESFCNAKNEAFLFQSTLATLKYIKKACN